MVRAAGIVGSLTFLSRVTGLARDLVIGYLFGTSSAADAFFVAFRIPNLLRRLVGEGAVAVAFVPVITDYLTHRSREEAMRMVQTLATLMAVVLVFLAAFGVLLARPLTAFFAPGFSGAKADLTTSLLRMTFLYLVFIGLVAVAMGVLHSLRHFATSAFSPVLLNLTMITCALLLSGGLEEPVFSLAYGVVLGGAGQLLIHIMVLRRFGVPLRPLWDFSHPAVRRVLLLLFPTLLGTAVYQLNIMTDTILASLLPEGSVSYLWYADRVFEFPLGVFVVALGTAALPSFAGQAQREDYRGLGESLKFSLKLTNLVALPAAVGLFVLAEPAVAVLFYRGEYGAEAVLQTARALRCFAVGLWAVAGVRLLASCFYALEDTRTPVCTAAAAFLVNVLFSLMLMGPVVAREGRVVEEVIAALSRNLVVLDLRHAGLALSTSLAALFQLLLLGGLLQRRLEKGLWREVAVSLGKSFLAALFMVWPVRMVAAQVFWLEPGRSLWIRGAFLLGAIAVGASVFMATFFFLDRKEARQLAPHLFRLLPKRLQTLG